MAATRQTVLDALAENVRRDAKRPAVTGRDETFTYGQLEERSNRIANLLQGIGVAPGSLVAISLERGPNVVAAIVGVLKAGAAYVPLDPDNPDERLQLIIEDASPAAFLTESSLAKRFVGAKNLIELDRDSRVASAPVHAPQIEVQPSALAYVIYTSGTTGRPKGVMITHGNLQSVIDATQPLFQFGSDDVWSLFHSYGFDFAVWEMWGALCFGGRVVVVDPATVRSPDAFYDLLVRERVTVLSQTPSALNSILSLEERGKVGDLALRYVVLGGEALDPRRLRRWFERRGDDAPRIINMYGITEITIHATYRRIVRADCDADAWSPIGVSLSNGEIRILNDEGDSVADGELGEIHVLGEGVARGYLNRPDLTRERFVTASDGRRMYRSGDLASRTPSGDINYHGRRDTQVQIRGFRVELGEIESALRRNRAVRDAVVAHLTDRPGGRLVAYVIPSAQGSFAGAEQAVREDVAVRLPPYMHPSTYVSIDTFPLTPNGKVDRAALPAPEEPTMAATGAEATLSATEARLAPIWTSLLGVSTVTSRTDFFGAGGHSLLAVEALIRTGEEFGIDVPLGTMFEHTTLRAVAAVVDRMTAGTEELVI